MQLCVKHGREYWVPCIKTASRILLFSKKKKEKKTKKKLHSYKTKLLFATDMCKKKCMLHLSLCCYCNVVAIYTTKCSRSSWEGRSRSTVGPLVFRGRARPSREAAASGSRDFVCHFWFRQQMAALYRR